jgi:hypothetical protein
MRIKMMVIASGCAAMMISNTSFASTLQVGSSSIILVAGQTVEVPIFSDLPITGSLTATGAFEAGDVTFTAGPECHLSPRNCTLLITASSNSKDYTAVPVRISEAMANNMPVFALSIVHPGEPIPTNTELPKNYSLPPAVTNQQHKENIISSGSFTLHSTTANSTQAPLLRSGNSLFYGIAQTHPGLSVLTNETRNNFTESTNGPTYQIVAVTNNDVAQPLSVGITGTGADDFSIDSEVSDYGANKNCAVTSNLATGDSCLVIVKGKIGDPRQAPKTATLTIQGSSNNVSSFNLTNTTYVYVAGGFNALGNANVSGGDLLAECTAGTCSNALQGSTGNNYASTNFSVGQWINALAITPSGNLLVGGVFGAIGGATSGATTGTAALLAQCTPGAVSGDSCINQLNTGSTSNPYAFSNAYINAITPPFTISSNNYIAVGGDFNQIRAFSAASGGRILAKCSYSGASANQTCSSYFTGSSPISKFANNAISSLGYFNGNMTVAGLFTQIAGYPTSPPSSGTTFASCSTSACSNGMGSNNPDSTILGITDDGTNLYMGGVFTQIGGYVDSSGGYPLVTCTVGSITTCNNALAGTNNANNYIQGLTYSGGNLYVGGRFTTIGGAAPVNGGNMLAICTPGGTCSNFVTDDNPYASGADWGGVISAIAVGNQTSINAN